MNIENLPLDIYYYFFSSLTVNEYLKYRSINHTLSLYLSSCLFHLKKTSNVTLIPINVISNLTNIRTIEPFVSITSFSDLSRLATLSNLINYRLVFNIKNKIDQSLFIVYYLILLKFKHHNLSNLNINIHNSIFSSPYLVINSNLIYSDLVNVKLINFILDLNYYPFINNLILILTGLSLFVVWKLQRLYLIFYPFLISVLYMFLILLYLFVGCIIILILLLSLVLIMSFIVIGFPLLILTIKFMVT